MPPRVLVVGGAGYIGSTCARDLQQAGVHVASYDDLSTGHREAVTGELIVGDIRDRALLTRVLREGHFDAVMHFAAKALVGESVSHPLRYFDTNTGGTIALVQSMLDAGVPSLVFSSTCAIYGDPQTLPLAEDHPRAPVNPYGHSKNMVEHILAASREREGLRVTTLRYFNAAGGMPDGSLGESHTPETHLIPLTLDAAYGARPPLKLFGTDYPTRDGTCVRDYVHVLDLAQAHRLALQRLVDGDPGRSYNVGTGTGTTVLEILGAVETITGRAVPYANAPRREGDPPALVASSALIRDELGWKPRFTDIETIVQTAATWARSRRY